MLTAGVTYRAGISALIHRPGTCSMGPPRVGVNDKKADVVEHPRVFDHVGLLFNEPPGTAGLPLI